MYMASPPSLPLSALRHANDDEFGAQYRGVRTEHGSLISDAEPSLLSAMTVTTPSLIYEVDLDTEADRSDEDAYDYATDEAEDSRGTAQQDSDIVPSTLTSHPIQRLPTELLILVFMHAVAGNALLVDARDSFSSPFAIASICHKWREVTLHTPELWSMVYYTIRDFSLIGSEERLAGLLTIQLSRSSLLPLDVSIALYAQPRGSLWPSISALFRRAQSFRVRIGRDLYEMLSSQVLCQNAPHLTHLAFDDRNSFGDELRLSLDAPVLRSFTFTGGCVEFPSISGAAAAYPTVRAVTVHTEFAPSILIDLVRSFPNITSLDLSWHDTEGTSFSEDDAPELELQLAYLESLTIDGRGETCVLPLEIARRLSLPSLRTARIKAKYEAGDFPWSRREEKDRRAVAALICSALRTVRVLELDLDLAGSGEDASDEALEFAGSGEDLDAAIVEALESCVQLEHLTLHIHHGGFEILTMKALSTPAWTLVLHVYHNHDTLSDALAIARRAASEGLARIEVHEHLKDSDSCSDAQSSCAEDPEAQSTCAEDSDTPSSEL